MCNDCFSNKELAEKIEANCYPNRESMKNHPNVFFFADISLQVTEAAREQTKKLLEKLDSMKVEKSLKQCNINLDII